MPTYEYQCQTCRQRVEAVQRFTDPALTICPHCGGELRKVFSAVGVVFKGSGFYKNDSRKAEKTAAPTSTAPTSTTPASSPSTESSTTPAATTASTTTTTSSATTSSD